MTSEIQIKIYNLDVEHAMYSNKINVPLVEH